MKRWLLLACLASAPASAQDLTAPRLGAATNFSQGIQRGALRGLFGYGIADLRDGMNWNLAETAPGKVSFKGARLTFPRQVAEAGASLSLTLNWGNDLYDGGDTPHTPTGIAAFGAFAGRVAAEFPGVDAIEIGNEFNGTNFVKGPLKDMRPDERAAAYAKLLVASHDAVKAVRPEVRILGGATHSIPAGYLWQVLDAGGAGRMDALALHPYTTPAEQFVRQVQVLRRHPDAVLPIEVTEFGEPDPVLAVGYFLRNYCQFALGGVTRAVWFPLTDRGDGFQPLFDAAGNATPVGEAYRFAEAQFAGRPVVAVAPDAFTYGCLFGTDHLVLWGTPRGLTVAAEVTALDATGKGLPAEALALSATDPLIFHRPGGIDLDRDIALEPQRVIADSFDQFAYPAFDGTPLPDDEFLRFARMGGQDIAFATLPGQDAAGTPWTPYLAAGPRNSARLTAETLLPAVTGQGAVEIVHRYVAPQDATLALDATFAAKVDSVDGIAISVTLNGATLAEEAGTDPILVGLASVDLEQGDVLDIVVGPRDSDQGDLTRYRITLRRP